MTTELEQVMATRRTDALVEETQAVYLMEGNDIAAYLVRRANGLWNGYIEACLDPREPLITNVSYDYALAELLEEDSDLKGLPIIYSSDPVIQP